MEKTYRIEELETTGWVAVEGTSQRKYEKLTKEKAKEALDYLISEGYNPNSLRAIPDGTTN